MKVLVTGGAGFIGSNIVDGAINAGHDVSVVDDLSTGNRRWVNPKSRFYEVDIRSAELDDVIAQEKPDVICHQAARANVRESFELPLLYADVNVVGSVNLLESARKHGVKRIVYASTGGACYGEPEQVPVPENHPVNPLDPYGASKHHVEHYLFLYKANFGIDYAILRYPNVFGPRQDPRGEAGVVAIFAMHMLEGGEPKINGDGSQVRDFMFIDDVVSANLCAFEKGSGIYNVGWSKGTSVNEIFDSLKSATGYKGPKLHGPAKQGEVQRIYLDSRRAQSELGWQPKVGLDEGLSRTVAFLTEEMQRTLTGASA
ncbi:MAG: NAD-dependent epimerase/dehydratase family protein [Bryobacterales bacterium]|nr:NAD-dependent epimerase/dehydratase family protein [Acidobacteriota bacterium]MCB9384649.1 NAD-dependent epimerase/dehydratase family protein [Bryobacterales bacterium]